MSEGAVFGDARSLHSLDIEVTCAAPFDVLRAEGPDTLKGLMGAVLHEASERIVDRYAIYEPIASGGMAVVHIGRLLGQAGFSRTVAVKRLHPQFSADPEFVAMLLDEARLAVRVQHPNVIAPLDVVVADGEVLVVMDYVSGETLSQLMRQASLGRLPPPAISARVLVDALYGLHAAHEAVAEDGSLLDIVHRDISPQNIIVGVDGVARVLDFGVAKAAMRSHATKEGEIKGKLAYMAPEQLKSQPLDRRVDLFAAGVVLWECLTGQRLFRGDDLGQTVERVLHSKVAPPSALNGAVPSELDAVVLRALERDPAQRFQTAREQAAALGAAIPLASPSQVADWVRELGGARLSQRIERVAAIESRSSSRLKVTGRSPLHTPLGLMAIGLPASARSAGSRDGAPRSADVARSRDDVPTVRPGRDESSSSSLGAGELGPRPTTSQRTKVVLGTVATVALAAGVTISWLTRWPSSAAPSAAPQATPVASSVAVVSVPPVEVPFALPTIEPSPAVSSPPAGKAALPRNTPRTGTAKAVSAVSKAGAKPASNCSPPFVVDERGIRRIKPECR